MVKIFSCRSATRRLQMDVSERLGQIYLSQGLTFGKIAYRIAEEKGMSYRWVMTYLPDKRKARPGLACHSKTLNLDKHKEKTSKSKVARLATFLELGCARVR